MMNRLDDHQPILDFQTAQNRLLANVPSRPPIINLSLDQALGCVLVEPILSPVAVPSTPLSALDGYAIRTTDLNAISAGGGDVRLPIMQRITAGQCGEPLSPGTAARIFTGAPLPEGSDAIVAQESTSTDGNTVRLDYLPKPWEDVKVVGSDLQRGERLLDSGRRLRPQDLGLIASAGIAEVAVYAPLRVSVLCTGDELIAPGHPLPPGGTYNANRFLIPAQIQALGMKVTTISRVVDTLDATIEAIKVAASQSDVILTTGGVSAGEEDYVRAAIESMGTIDIWRVNVKPGRPFTLGKVGEQDTPVIGLPGNPVSAFINFALFARPFLLACQGVTDDYFPTFHLPARFSHKRPSARHEFLRARYEDAPTPAVHVYPNQGSSALKSASWANGIVSIPPGRVVNEGELVAFIPLSRFDL